jgi:hypothetical protein
MSGEPGRSFLFSRNRYPIAWITRRTAISGFESRVGTAAIIRLRVSASTMSTLDDPVRDQPAHEGRGELGGYGVRDHLSERRQGCR